MGAERLRCPEEVLGSLWERTLISGRLLTLGAMQSEECCQALRLQWQQIAKYFAVPVTSN